FLKDPSKRDILIFLLMFIPGTPKDVLTYFAPLSGISTARFLIIASVARIPSVITSTYVGGTLAKGQLLWAAVVFCIVGIVSIGGIMIYNKIIDANNKEKNGQKNG
ncbi:MAG: TVP38/TMEM64 family protein, partial [Clostridia bacterium]|nr:TVP38/TMEM64 family protein [Clostridia bacterium]